MSSGWRELLPLVDKEDNTKSGRLWDSFWLFFWGGVNMTCIALQ